MILYIIEDIIFETDNEYIEDNLLKLTFIPVMNIIWFIFGLVMFIYRVFKKVKIRIKWTIFKFNLLEPFKHFLKQ